MPIAFKKTTKPVTRAKIAFLLVPVVIAMTACTESNELPPVADTRTSGDEQILNASGLMSDGQPVPPHRTSTLETSAELVSDGLIGGMTVAADGSIFTTDFGSHIYEISITGETTLFSGEFEDPSGNLMLADGDILQSEWTNNRIYRIAPDGTRSLFSDANLDGPVAIVRRPQGDFIVANSRGKFLARVPENGGDAEIVLQDERVTQPNGLTIDPDGNIYIADIDRGNVFRWTPDGTLTSVAELPGRGNAHNVYANGMLYVNKIWDHVVYIVDPETGAYGIVSGNGRPGYADGITGTATLEEPNAIALAPDGKSIYVNTHRGHMGRDKNARIVIRKLVRMDAQ